MEMAAGEKNNNEDLGGKWKRGKKNGGNLHKKLRKGFKNVSYRGGGGGPLDKTLLV